MPTLTLSEIHAAATQIIADGHGDDAVYIARRNADGSIGDRLPVTDIAHGMVTVVIIGGTPNAD